MSRFYAFFSGFPTHHFPDEIAARLRAEIPVRNDLVFVSAWPSDHSRNDADAAGMHEMFAEQRMGFERFHVIDDRTESELALKLITEASCIFLMGGNATAQMQLICDKGIRGAIISGSAATLGVSAGSMNMGKTTVDIWESLLPYEGLGFADITMIGHFSNDNEERLGLIKQVSMDHPVCAMADESAIFIRNAQVTCTGEIHWIENGEIKAFSPEQKAAQMVRPAIYNVSPKEVKNDYGSILSTVGSIDQTGTGSAFLERGYGLTYGSGFQPKTEP